jgi:gas vesicle structural protein
VLARGETEKRPQRLGTEPVPVAKLDRQRERSQRGDATQTNESSDNIDIGWRGGELGDCLVERVSSGLRVEHPAVTLIEHDRERPALEPLPTKPPVVRPRPRGRVVHRPVPEQQQRHRQRLVRVPPRLTAPERRRGRVRGKSDLTTRSRNPSARAGGSAVRWFSSRILWAAFCSEVAVATQGTASNYLQRAPSPSGLADVVDLILDKGLVIDAYVRIAAVGIELITIDARIVIASVDTYLRFAEAVNRLDLNQTEMAGIDALREGASAAKDKSKGAVEGVKKEAKGPYETLKKKVKG